MGNTEGRRSPRTDDNTTSGGLLSGDGRTDRWRASEANMEAPAEEVRETTPGWKTGLFDCFLSPVTCCLGAWCPCVLYAKNVQAITGEDFCSQVKVGNAFVAGSDPIGWRLFVPSSYKNITAFVFKSFAV